jgi:hypothetical protein
LCNPKFFDVPSLFKTFLHREDLNVNQNNVYRKILKAYLPMLKSNAEELNERLQEVSDTLNDIGKVNEH